MPWLPASLSCFSPTTISTTAKETSLSASAAQPILTCPLSPSPHTMTATPHWPKPVHRPFAAKWISTAFRRSLTDWQTFPEHASGENQRCEQREENRRGLWRIQRDLHHGINHACRSQLRTRAQRSRDRNRQLIESTGDIGSVIAGETR